MTIKKIDYQKVFNTGNYTSARYGIEIELEEGDSEITAMRIAKETVEKFHNEKYVDQRGSGIKNILENELPVIMVNEL